MAPGIDTLWQRIESQAGAEFRMIRGGDFRFSIVAGHVIPDRTAQQIPKSHFEKALALVPLAGTAPLQHLRGPSFINAILMDSRIATRRSLRDPFRQERNYGGRECTGTERFRSDCHAGRLLGGLRVILSNSVADFS
jgi:hypothetical protein